MAVDWNDMLHMHVVNGLQEWPCAHESWGYPCAQQGEIMTSVTAGGTVLWTCPFLPLTTSGRRSVYYALRLTEDKCVEPERVSAHFVSDETEGQGGHALDIFLAPHDVAFDTIFAEFEASDGGVATASLRHQMRLRLKPDRKGATGRKKRAGIAWD